MTRDIPQDLGSLYLISLRHFMRSSEVSKYLAHFARLTDRTFTHSVYFFTYVTCVALLYNMDIAPVHLTYSVRSSEVTSISTHYVRGSALLSFWWQDCVLKYRSPFTSHCPRHSKHHNQPSFSLSYISVTLCVIYTKKIFITMLEMSSSRPDNFNLKRENNCNLLGYISHAISVCF
jgi:hypothetical protein